MIKLFISLMFLVNTSFAFSQTYFEQIGQMFYEGGTPKVEEIMLTPWTGRCFNSTTPNTPTNIGFYIRVKERAPSEDTGPIEITQYEISNYTFHGRSANYLDDKNHDYLARLIEPHYESLNVGQDHFSFFNRRSGRRVWGHLRSSQDYLVQGFYDEYGREGKIRCYYWRTGL